MLCSDAVIWGWLIHSTQCLLSSYISTQTPFVATLHCSLKTPLPIDQQLCVAFSFAGPGHSRSRREASMHRHRSECHMHQQRHPLAAGCIATMGSELICPSLPLPVIPANSACSSMLDRSRSCMHHGWSSPLSLFLKLWNTHTQELKKRPV
jgi:hypothetical protein